MVHLVLESIFIIKITRIIIDIETHTKEDWQDKNLRDSIDYSVFLDCPRDVRFQRRLERDIKERGRNYNDVVNLFETRLDYMHSKFVEPYKSKCDLILNTNENIDINPLVKFIKKNL